MGLVYADMKLCDIILQEPTLIPVINRFGISLGVGDKNVQTVCKENKLDTNFFLTILNTFINKDFFPEKKLKSFCASQIVDYLSKTNDYYEHFQLPNIERHFHSLLSHSTGKNNLEYIRQFFGELKNDLLKRIDEDRTQWFPAIKKASEQLTLLQPDVNDFSIDISEQRTDPLEEKLNDLKSLFIIHLSVECDENLCYGVIFAIYTLAKDIKQNNRIRHRILKPLSEALQLASAKTIR
ncbi:helix-turn-helix transcriptional regulator [Coprobacter tertius]|uniref:Helix-turn-helix transcriptional regulator n=1 Tax=Coprobacter tertius TaxID=2944915 RepID=A0ABT1MEL4_9BACT|nr:helix-turn-helix transcriptional regulator [Coprobacter tertius]MCP9611067.1 helix-turn-helix transcriptional regulator [Coprobacter tertius]